ncbi:hypothetical protein Tco_0019028 [Tanacetum coccineum]
MSKSLSALKKMSERQLHDQQLQGSRVTGKIQSSLTDESSSYVHHWNRSTFANPKYLKKAQSEKPRLYEIPYDTSDPANRFCPNGEETVTLEKESRSKLDKDTVKPYDYTYQNSLYKTFKPPSKTYLSVQSKKPERQIPTGHRFSNKKTTTVPEKTMNPRSCLRWQPTGRILKTVCLRWVPTGKLLNSCTGKVDSEPTHGSIVDIPHIQACKQTLGLSAGTSFNGQKQQRIDITADALYNEKQENLRVWLLKFLISKKPVPECSSLVLHQMTSDHNRSELGIQDHSNEQSSSKLVPKVVPLAVKTATSRQELELLFHHHIAMLRTTGINPMIQPEPEDLPKDNPKLEIAVLSSTQAVIKSPMPISLSIIARNIRSDTIVFTMKMENLLGASSKQALGR